MTTTPPRTTDRRRWNGRSLQVRVLVLVGVGMLASLAVMGGATWLYLDSLGRQMLAERGVQARAIASHVDFVLDGDLEILQGVLPAPAANPRDHNPQPERSALGEATVRARLFDRVLLVNGDGTWWSGQQPAIGAANARLVRDLAEARTTGRPAVSPLLDGPAGMRRAYAFVPLRDWRGRVTAVAIGEMDPTGSRLAQVLPPLAIGASGSIDVLDGAGVVVSTTDPPRLGFATDEAGLVRDAVARRQAVVETCRDCRVPGGDDRADEVVAIAPLASAPWAVSIRQPERETFGTVFALDRNLALLASVLIALALLFAWGVARSVRNPLALLTQSAERIADGNRDSPVPSLPDDEVGRMGRALEHMRVALNASIGQVERANSELEERVRQRTSELESLYRELQAREAWRGQLLAKVISAQEDERKRLARELHDETSQTLNALVMRLETAVAAFPDETSRQRLIDAKALAVRILDELHRLIYDLRPSVLDDLGLLSAIRWYAERQLEPLGVAVRWEFSGQERRLQPEVETALFRVAQEAITNIAKYAHAESVLIQCMLKNDEISLEIEDDGDGFDPASLPSAGDSRRGLGLMGMRERVELLSGTIEIDAAPGQGVRIAVVVPLTHWILEPAPDATVPGPDPRSTV